MDTTLRLVLRRYRPGDLAAYMAYRRDPDVVRFQSYGGEAADPEAEALAYFAEMEGRNPSDGGWFNWCVARRDDDEPIGDVGIRVEGNMAMIGYGMIAAHRGQGLMREAVGAAIDWLRDRGVRRAVMEIEEPNTRSRSLAEAMGFAFARQFTDEGVEVLVFERDLSTPVSELP
jgi:RimJ/RimL family protein N-acetyltransferase